MSSDGRYVVFSSNGSKLVDGDTNAIMDVFRRDRIGGEMIRVVELIRLYQGNPDWRHRIFAHYEELKCIERIFHSAGYESL